MYIYRFNEAKKLIINADCLLQNKNADGVLVIRYMESIYLPEDDVISDAYTFGSNLLESLLEILKLSYSYTRAK